MNSRGSIADYTSISTHPTPILAARANVPELTGEISQVLYNRSSYSIVYGGNSQCSDIFFAASVSLFVDFERLSNGPLLIRTDHNTAPYGTFFIPIRAHNSTG